MARASMQKRLKTAAMKVIKRWTQQSMAVGWNTWSSAVRNEKRMRNVLQKVLARWHKSYLSAAWQTWSWSAAETVRIQALGRKVVARLQNQTAGVAFMRWLGKAGEEKKVRQVARKVVLRWESASKMKAFMRWEDAVAEAREEMTKSAEQASKDSLANELNQLNEELSKQMQKLQRLEATHTKKIMEAAQLRDKLQNVEKRVDEIQHELNRFVIESRDQKSAMLKLSEEKLNRLGTELFGLKTLLEHERESRRSAEQQAQRLVSAMTRESMSLMPVYLNFIFLMRKLF